MNISMKMKVRNIIFAIISMIILQLCGCNEIASIILGGVFGTTINFTIEYCNE